MSANMSEVQTRLKQLTKEQKVKFLGNLRAVLVQRLGLNQISDFDILCNLDWDEVLTVLKDMGATAS
jgi:hypothetical protein